KTWQERLVCRFSKQFSFDVTIMRPGFIWGHQHAKIAGMGRSFGPFYILFGPLSRLPLSHVENCADCIVSAAENPISIGKVFNVIDSDEIRVWQYVRKYARYSGALGFFIPIPYRLGLGLAHAVSLSSKALIGPNAKIPSLLQPHRY